jgi:hypothetical protein
VDRCAHVDDVDGFVLCVCALPLGGGGLGIRSRLRHVGVLEWVRCRRSSSTDDDKVFEDMWKICGWKVYAIRSNNFPIGRAIISLVARRRFSKKSVVVVLVAPP